MSNLTKALIISIVVLIGSLITVSHEQSYCGVIKTIEAESVNSTGGKRSRIYTERFVLIKFEEGFTRAINLEPTSYYTAKVGKHVCVDISDIDLNKEPEWSSLMVIMSLASIAVIVLIFFWREMAS